MRRNPAILIRKPQVGGCDRPCSRRQQSEGRGCRATGLDQVFKYSMEFGIFPGEPTAGRPGSQGAGISDSQLMVEQTQQPLKAAEIRICLIGEDPAARAEIGEHLQAELPGAVIVGVASGEDLDAVLGNRSCGLCVIASREPRDCLRAAERMRRRQPGCPLLLLLELRNEQLAADATRLGVDRYIIRTPSYGPRLRAAVADMISAAAKYRETVHTLESSARQFQNLVENSAQGILVEVDGAPIYANRALARIFGYDDPQELLGITSIHDLADERERGRILRLTENRKSGREAPDSYVFRARRKDGSLIWLENRVNELSWQGRPAVQSAMVDVSERQRATNALRLTAGIASKVSEQDDFQTAVYIVLRRLARGMGWSIAESWLPSAAGDVLEPGPAWYGDKNRYRRFMRVSGELSFKPGAGSVGRAWSTGRPEWIADLSNAPGLLRRSIVANEAGLKAGCTIPVLAHGRTVAVLCFFFSESYPDKGSLIAALGAGTAPLGLVLSRIRTEQARRASMAQMETLISENVDGILVVDENDRILFANPAAQEALGRAQDDLRGMPFGTPSVHDNVAEIEIHNPRTGAARVNEMRVADIDWEGRSARLVSLRDITDRLEAQRALESHEAALRERVKELHCLYTVSDHLARRDADWTWILQQIADSLRHGWQYPESARVRLGIEDVEVVSRDFRETEWSLSQDVVVDGEVVGRIEVFYVERKPDSDIGPFLEEERNLLGDISRRISQTISARRYQQELHHSRRRFQDFAEAASDWLWEMDADLRFTYFSDRIETVMGHPVDHWLGKSRREITGEDVNNDPKWLQHLSDLESRRPFKDFRYDVALPDGTRKHISISGIPVFDEHDRFVGYRGTGTDETRQVEALFQATESERRLRNIGDRLPGIVFQRLRKKDGTIEYPYLSAGIADHIGYRIDEVQRDPLCWADQIHPEDRPRFQVALAESSQTLEPMDIKFRMFTRHGDERWFWHRSRPRRLDNGDTLWDCIELDITEQKKAEARVQYLGYHDQLTGLPNRELFVERVNQVLPIAGRNGQSVAVAMLGLKRFKQVNEEFGMSGGDEVLRAAAERFEQCLRPGDTIARLGGDRFLFLLPSVSMDTATHKPLERMVAAMERPFTVKHREIMLSFNMGVAVFPEHGDSVEELIQKADTAQSHYGRWGPGFGFTFYQDRMPEAESSKLALEKDLRDAVASGSQLEPYYQPLYDASSGRLVGVETLARWNHPERGMISPAEFIGLAEESGLIIPLGLKILRRACVDARQREGSGLGAIIVTVNLSAAQIRDPGLARSIQEVLEETGMAPDTLVLEVTESTLIADLDRATEFMDELVAVGVRFALDDFGVGYSSLSYLGRLPVQMLKIDRSFIRDLESDSRSEATVKAIVALAHALELHVVAEGIETSAQMERVKQLGCDTLQGFRLGRPMPAKSLDALLTRREPPGDDSRDAGSLT